MSDSIKVAIKVRPLIKREKDDNLTIQWVVQGNSIISTDPEIKKRGDGGFCFDHIFDMNVSNSDVFDTIVKPIVNAAVNGFNGTVFAYGQTSSGKTYTMMGTAEEPGIIPLAIEHMFDAIANTAGREFLLRVSYLEIYNEKVNDLLNKAGTDLKLKEDGSGQVVLQCKEEITNCPENVLSIMKKGDKHRRIGETNMNERSSRSHTIFRITIESREAGGNSDGAIQVSQLNLVDLAGSERARQTGATGERFKEGRHINMSLSTLGLVIMQLSESQDSQKHVNFRDSKLTRLLQSSLGGNAMTAIICAVTPAALEETQCTLSFASRAKSVKNKPQVNEVMSDAALLKRYARQLTKLQEELKRIKNENRSAEVEEMESKLQEKDRINQLLEERIELLKTRIVSGDNASQDSSKCKYKRRQTWGGPGMFNQHLSIFQSKTSLPTIKEVSFEKPQRKSILQSMNIINQTFQTAFTDFELELFESERDREDDSDEEPFVTKRKNHVTFKDDLCTIASRSDSLNVTPEKCNISTQTMSYQASPSTPKHVLRRCITDLTREFVELREFTTLEKQLICQENRCHPYEEEEIGDLQKNLTHIEQPKSISEYDKIEYIPEIAMQLKTLNLADEKDVGHIITKLCVRLNEIEKQNILEKESNNKIMKQFSEVEKQIENITSERNEFEYISRELRAELKKKTAELELKNMSEENIRQEETKKILELEKQIENITSEKNKFERISNDLHIKSTKQIEELQKQIENINSERSEFEYIRRELCTELNKKSMELEKLKNNLESDKAETVNKRITELKAEVENITSEKNKFKHINDELCTELNRTSLEFESKIAIEQEEKQKAIEKVSELEKHIEQTISGINEYDHANVELKAELNKKIADLELKIESITFEKNELKRTNTELNKNASEIKAIITSQEAAYQQAVEKISELEKKIEDIALERNDLQRINIALHTELDENASEFEKKVTNQRIENEKTMKKISEFEKQITNMMSEKNELERINTELRTELNQKVFESKDKVMSEQIENQKVVEKISELESQISNMISEKSQLEHINNELRNELNQKSSELEVTALKQSEYQQAIEKVSELQNQITNVITEKNELKCINNELQVKLDSELKEKTNLEEMKNQETMKKISELENQITSLISEKSQLEHINNELRNELNQRSSELEVTALKQSEYQQAIEKVSELQNQITNLITEKNKLECINNELQVKLDSELKEKTNLEEIKHQKTMEKISELETQIENITSEKNNFELINIELRAELNAKISELQQNPVERISELEDKITSIMFKKNELERINDELHTELKQISSKLETRAVGESEYEEPMKKISEFEKQIGSIRNEENEFKHINNELRIKLNEKVFALKSKIISQQIGDQNLIEMITELEIEIKDIITREEEFEYVVTKLRAELDRESSALELEQIEKQKAVERISELNKQIEHTMSERNEFEHLNNLLSAELNKNVSELESDDIVQEITNLEAVQEMPEFTCTDKLRDESDKEDSKFRSDCDYDSENDLKSYIKELQHTVTNLRKENQDLRNQLENHSILSSSKLNESNADASFLILNMETEKSQLEEKFQIKSQELEDIKSDVQSLKTDIKNLQETIYLLTTENMEMASKLNTEQEKAKQTEFNLQKTIDELYVRISEVTNDKITLESDLEVLNNQLESMRSKMSVINDEKQLFASYESKIDKLTAENIELSTCIREKNKELENIKESKSLLYDHECTYKEKTDVLVEKNKYLSSENNELSTDLIEKIEENDMLKEQCNILKNKIEQSLGTNENVAGNDLEHLRTENNTLKAEIAELKTKVTILFEENTKFSTNLLETMENLDSSRNEKSCNNSLHLSMMFNEVNESKQKISEDETLGTAVNKITTLQNKIDHLIYLNKKLSDLKLTSCKQCVHLRNLNESRRALKLEAKILSQKLEDLQRKFDRKCADTEILKNKINQEISLNELDVSSNISFVNEMNLSFVEERIQNLNDELQTLRIDHDKLSVLYEDKCNELEQLQSGMITNVSNTNDSTSKKSLNENGNRMQQIQNYIDQLRIEMDEVKKNSMNFNATLNEFKTEKATLLNEINGLKDINEELQQKLSNDESIAIKKIQILENELTSVSKEIEQSSMREKELESQKLMLQVELESLKVEEQNKNTLINQLNECASSLKSELDLVTSQKNELINSSTIKCKEEELQHLKKRCEELENEKIQAKELEECNILRIKELETNINEFQRKITNQEHYSFELQEKHAYLEKLLQEREQKEHMLVQKLQSIETEAVDFKNDLEIKYKNEFDSMILQYQEHIKEYENNLQRLNDTLNKYIDENLNLTQELANLRCIKENFNEATAEKERIIDQQELLMSNNEKLNEELNDIRKCVIKELRSLKYNPSSTDFSSKSVNEIFMILLQVLVCKEQEVIKSMQEMYEKKIGKIKDEKQQCIDTEKRTTAWAKELEAEVERLQTELTARERIDKEYQNKISQLEDILRETTHEKEMVKEKLEVLEMDLNNLQIEFDKQCKVDYQQEDAILVAQKKEKEVQEILHNKEGELQSKFKSEKEMYEKKINNLVHVIESNKTKILELNSTIEGLEANEKQLKNIIEANSVEMKKNSQNVKKVNAELEQLTQVYNEVNQEMEQKNAHIEEITKILKNKCDTLSEYKTRLETIVPEYEMVQERVKNQKSIIEQCKQEIEVLKKEREEELEIIKNKLYSEEVKSAGLSKQLNELNNKNIALIEELNSLKVKYENLQEENAKLDRKLRNSTSKIKAEAEIEELRELNKRLQNNLEGASNRVTESQGIKNQALKDLAVLKDEYECVLQENNELKKGLSSYKSDGSISSSSIDEGKYNALLLVKNKIALELEDKKIILNRKDKEIEEYANQIQQLTNKNKELDDELEEYATIIKERDIEISRLEGKLYSLTENALINEVEGKLTNLNEENEKLRDQVEALKMRLQMDVEKDVKLQNEKTIRNLKKENLELQMTITDYKKRLDDDGPNTNYMNKLKSSDTNLRNNLEGTCSRITELEEEKSRTVQELEKYKLLLNQKNKELKDYIEKVGDLIAKNKKLHNELEGCAKTIRDRDVEISKLKTNLSLYPKENESNNDIKQTLQLLTMENKKLKNEIKELQMKSQINVHHGKKILKDGIRKQHETETFDKDFSEHEESCKQLKKKIRELELQLVTKNGTIAKLELQIRSENFPYQKKCKELEELVLAFRNKNAELMSDIRKYQRTVNDVNAWECDICRRWLVNRKDQGCQTIPSNAVRFCSSNSGVVEDHVKIQKLEKEKMLMKDLCRSRVRQIKELQDRIKELEEAQSSLSLRSNEVLQDRSNQQCSNVTYFNRQLNI